MDGHVLRGVLNHCHICLGQLLGHFCTVFIWVGFLHFLEDLFQELSLFVFLLSFNLFFDFGDLLLDLLGWLLVGFFGAGHELFAILGHHVIVECSVRVFFLEEGELRFMRLHLHQCFFELQPILRYVICCLIKGLLYLPWRHDYPVHLLYIIESFARLIFAYNIQDIMDQQQLPTITDLTPIFNALPDGLGEKYAQRIAVYQKRMIPFQISRINENKNLSSKNSSLERHKLDLMKRIHHLTEKNKNLQHTMEKQSEKIMDLSRTVAELDRANNDNLSIIEVFRITIKQLQAQLNQNIEAVKKVEHEKKEILDQYETVKNEFNALLQNYMKDKNSIAEKLNYLNQLEQSLIEKQKKLKQQEAYLKKQWEQFEQERKDSKQRPKIFKKPSEQVVPSPNTKVEKKEQKQTIIDEILRNPIKKIIKHHSSEIYDGCFSEDNALFITCGGDRNIKIYDMFNYQTANIIQSLEDSTFLCLSAEGGQGQRLLTGSTDKSLQVFEIGTGKELHRFVDHGMKVNSVSWLNDKDTVVSGSEDKHIKIWSLEKLSNISSISCGKPVKCLISKMNEPLIYSGHSDGSVRVYSANQSSPVSQIKGIIDRSINSIYPMENAQQLLVSSQEGSPIHILDLKMNKSVKKYEGQDYCNTAGRAVASRTQKFIIAGNCDGYLYYWNKEKASFEKKLSGHDYGISVVRSGQNGKLVSCDNQGNVIVWSNN